MEKGLTTLVYIAVILLAATIGGIVFMLLWNFVAKVYWPQAPEVGFFQAWATVALVHTLFPPNYGSKK